MSQRFIGITSRRQEKILVINTSHLKPKQSLSRMITRSLVSFFSGLDVISSSKLLWIAAAGVGLGLGFSVTVVQRPSLAGASLPLSRISSPNDGLTVPKSLELPFEATSIEVEWEPQSGELGDNQVVVVYLTNTDSIDKLQQLSAGEVLKIFGTNDGIYSYRVTEIKIVSTQQISALLQQPSNSLQIYAPLNFLKTEHILITAKPN